ncbi:MAG: sigma-70 family RNA polymerase sigma factor [Chitinophagaceae bacterium]|nr:MAG: sigma-70 family RNA polymerase sigma factor [Chitinophagaceae bacterium]
MNNKQDNELIFQLQKGSIKAFNSVYEKYHQALYRNILKITKNQETTEDILQDVFVALWEKRMELDEGKTLSGWLFVISFNKAINYTKKELTRLHAKNKLSDLYSETSQEDDHPEIYEQRHELLQQAMTNLSPQKQKVLILCKIEGKTYEEAANMLNISKHTVKEYLSEAMNLVKVYIKSHPQYINAIDITLLLLLYLYL